MIRNLKGELAIMDSMNLKSNYTVPGRKYRMDYRTVKKYHNGYEGRPKTRNKGRKLDYFRAEIADKLRIKRLTVKGVYEFMVKKYGIERIGTYCISFESEGRRILISTAIRLQDRRPLFCAKSWNGRWGDWNINC